MRFSASGILALAAIAGVGFLWWKGGALLTKAGNAAAGAATDGVHTLADKVGTGLIWTVDAIGLAPYLKSISDTNVTPGEASPADPSGTIVDGQTYTFGY